MAYIGTPYTRNAGYFRSDDSPSGGKLREDNVRTCPHCQAVILMSQWGKVIAGKMQDGFCNKCNAPICTNCTPALATVGCLPYIAKLERDFDMTVKLRQFQKLAGLSPEPARGFFTGLISSKD